MLKKGNVVQGISRKIRTLVQGWVGGCFESKAYSHVQGRWVGHKCDDLRCMCFLDDPKRGNVLQKGHFVFPSSITCIVLSLRFLNKCFPQSEYCTLQKSVLS